MPHRSCSSVILAATSPISAESKYSFTMSMQPSRYCTRRLPSSATCFHCSKPAPVIVGEDTTAGSAGARAAKCVVPFFA